MNSIPLTRGPIVSLDLAPFDLTVQSGGCPEPKSLADQIEAIDGALAAPEIAKLLRISKISIYKGCKAGRIPCFRILSSVRFDPKSVAAWLRKQ